MLQTFCRANHGTLFISLAKLGALVQCFQTFFNPDQVTVKQLQTFDGDIDDVVRDAQAVGGRAAVVSCVAVHHIRNPEGLLKVLKGQTVAGQLPSIFLPGDVRSGPVKGAKF